MKSITLMPGAPPVSTSTFDHFYRAHRPDAVRWAVALVGDRGVAEELAQEALATMSGRLDVLDNPIGYLRRTVVNRAASWHRSHAREQRRIHRAAAGQPTSYSAETHEMLGALATLPYWDDWTDDQIADALGCAPATVRVLLHRALATLRTEITR
jgi:DNA-directed RNA polymerase specialized sigma24 family protein